MSRTNYEAAATGSIAGLAFDRRNRSNQIESHPKKNPGAGLARASLARSPTDCDTYLRKLAPKRGWCV